jgi:hypothetical protein
MVVNIKDIPAILDEWREINVRDAKLNSGVARKISETLHDDPDSFFFKNRGMTIIVDKATYDNKKNVVEIEVSDKKRNGLLDGGHTFKVIREYLENITEDELVEIKAFVKIEILEGVKDYESVVGIVEARNTSTQVKEQSIQELLQKYELVKDVLKNESYANRIAYKEFELTEEADGEKKAKDIDIREILSYLMCFDVESYDNNAHPIKAYSTRSSVLDYFRSNENEKRIKKYIPLLPQVLELRDVIYLELPEAYNKIGGKFGALTGVSELSNKKKNKTLLPFTEKESSYIIPSGFIYPILASFRNLINCDEKKCTWKADPIKFFREYKEQLAERVGEQAKEFRNPNKLGKDKATWGRCYDLIQLEVLKRNL